MKKLFLLLSSYLVFMPHASAFDISLLFNNKEAFSREITKDEIKENARWVARHPLKEELVTVSKAVLQSTFNEMERIDTGCELGLVNRLEADASKSNAIFSAEDMPDFIRYLRLSNLIDDVLYKMMKEAISINQEFADKARMTVSLRPFNLNTSQNAGIDLKKLYAPVKVWPDEIQRCSFDVYWNMVSGLKWKNDVDLQNQMTKLNWMAYKEGLINRENYNRLEILKARKVFQWPVYFNRYADIMNNAKDKMTKTRETTTNNDFTVEYVSKRDKITQRGNLYHTYTSTQIILMTQILERTAKRMDARFATLNWEFTDGEREIYVLSPMEQYRAAIRMLRKDIAEVMRSETFRNTGIKFEHIVAAAFETGYIKSDELALVIKFEEFWNPKTPKWKAYANFAFSLAGSASLFLPPPWNIVGAIAIVLTQSAVLNNGKTPDPDDNSNVII